MILVNCTLVCDHCSITAEGALQYKSHVSVPADLFISAAPPFDVRLPSGWRVINAFSTQTRRDALACSVFCDAQLRQPKEPEARCPCGLYPAAQCGVGCKEYPDG